MDNEIVVDVDNDAVDGILALSRDDNISKFVMMIKMLPPIFLRTRAFDLIHGMFRIFHIRGIYGFGAHVNCARYMLELFELTDNQYIRLTIRILSLYLVEFYHYSIDFQNRIVNILDKCINKIQNRQRLLEKIPKCFVRVRIISPDDNSVEYYMNDLVIKFIFKSVITDIVIRRYYPSIFLRLFVAINPNLISEVIVMYINNFRNFVCRSRLRHTIISIITPAVVGLLDDQRLNVAIFIDRADNHIYPIVIKLTQCGYNIPRLYRFIDDQLRSKVLPESLMNKVMLTKIYRHLSLFN